MEKLIKVQHLHISQLRPGMQVVDPGLDPKRHPYLYIGAEFLDSEEAVRRIVDEGYQEIYIDPARSPGLPPAAPLALDPAFAVPVPDAVPRSRKVSLAEELRVATVVHDEGVCYVRNFMRNARAGRLDMKPASGIMEKIMLSIERNADALLSLSRLRCTDSYTYMHCVNVSVLTSLFARYIGKDSNAVFTAGLAGMFHDLGKSLVPPLILNAPRKLSHAERDIINAHPTLGYEQLVDVPGVQPEVLMGALQHHEKFDGTGYPRKLSGKQISDIGCMVAAADVYDALTSRRAYKEGMSPHRALGIMYNEMRGKELRPDLMPHFIRMLGVYPVGSVVELTDGSLAVVSMGNDRDPLRPAVTVVRDTMGKVLVPFVVRDLSAKSNGLAVARCIPAESTNIDPAQVLGISPPQPLLL